MHKSKDRPDYSPFQPATKEKALGLMNQNHPEPPVQQSKSD